MILLVLFYIGKVDLDLVIGRILAKLIYMHVVKAREIGHLNESHFYNTIAAILAFTMFNSECAHT